MEQDNIDLIPELDREYLEEKGFNFELITYQGGVHLILKNFPFPETYLPRQSDVLIMIPVGYPNAQLDMFWTYPEVKLADGNVPVTTEHRQEFHEKIWQRWSRHGPWRPSKDNLMTFISSIKSELQKGR